MAWHAAAKKAQGFTQSCPDCHWQSVAVERRWIGKTLRPSGMNAPGDSGTGDCIDEIVSGRTSRRCKRQRERQTGQSQQFPPQNETRLVGPTFYFFRLWKRSVAVQAPERQFRMDLENARREFWIGPQDRIDLADLRGDVEQLPGHFAWWLRGGERGVTSGDIVRGVDRGSRRNREHRRLTLPEQRPDGILGSAAAVTRSFGQPDRNVDGDDRGHPRCGEHVGKIRINGDDAVVASRPDESGNPATRAAVNPRQPHVSCSLTHRPDSGTAVVPTVGWR